MHPEIIAVSNLEGEGVNKLRKVLLDVASKQPYWGELRPIRWIMLADKLSEQRELRRDEPMMHEDEVLKTAQDLGMHEGDVQKFLNFHHNVGDLVYFDEEGVSDTVILCPQWLGNVFR